MTKVLTYGSILATAAILGGAVFRRLWGVWP